MRFTTLAVIAITGAMLMPATPLLAATQHTHEPVATEAVADAPTFDDCFKLAWVRGVHVERFELDDFDAECMAGHVPFDSGMAVDSVKRETQAHQPHS